MKHLHEGAIWVAWRCTVNDSILEFDLKKSKQPLSPPSSARHASPAPHTPPSQLALPITGCFHNDLCAKNSPENMHFISSCLVFLAASQLAVAFRCSISFKLFGFCGEKMVNSAQTQLEGVPHGSSGSQLSSHRAE
ncbi:hypothetical protein PGT21_014486 [Puccinia graminis f. sp. tritici]|uniref:Uncharacterized protein n=1 Tax=Puccinia graminis f. sp. tritici TaxID=56615 RepID=A0A5B0NC35_PUCGR|nr:hypothetical protein PGT21_014486 [Puccinia graminis f. sp. tritici]